MRPTNIYTPGVIWQTHLNILVRLTTQSLKAAAARAILGLKTNTLDADQRIDCQQPCPRLQLVLARQGTMLISLPLDIYDTHQAPALLLFNDIDCTRLTARYL